MERLKELIREPALLIDLGETLVLLVVAFGIGLSGDQQTYIVAAIVAVLGLLKGFMTRPFPPSAVTDFGRAGLALFASFGVGLTADQIALIVTALGLITTVVLRGQITPAHDPVIDVRGAGAGPVKGEAGYTILGALGVGIIVLTVLLLVLTLLKVFAVSYIVLVVLFVIGLVLLLVDSRHGRGVL